MAFQNKTEGNRMHLARLRRGIIAGLAAFNQSAAWYEKIWVALLGLGLLVLIFAGAYALLTSVYNTYSFGRLSTAEHLARARAACGGINACESPSAAMIHLRAIPQSAPEYIESHKLADAIAEQETRERETKRQKSLEQMMRNVQGLAHDSFICAMSTEQKPIMSFDGGDSWWNDDDRCGQHQQERKNEDAQASSYFPTTIRVDTDIDSSWLPDEERTCQTYPNEKGRVSTVACDSAKSRRDHNIPVKFFGGVDRDTISDWKCRREKSLLEDEFVCRAIN